MPDGIQQYVKLENRLVLLSWLNNLLGYTSNKELLQDTCNAGEGFGADGHSFLYHHFMGRGSQVKLPVKDLARYDQNIRSHLMAMNRGRSESITLRYFQYLAALYTEIFLDRLFDAPLRLLADLNTFVRQRNAQRLPTEPQDEPFARGDLTKLAFWMATGSGKTLILHLNFRQYLSYNKEDLDNILLITPNEGLSEQHLQEFAASGIPARRFDLNHSTLWTGSREVVQVIEITKLVGEKRGAGVSVPVEAFEGRNLIFVDEGHKGAGGEAWRRYRESLGETGFTFEYSATFGQALSAARNDTLTAEYGKAIIFNYSYKYFYSDGFGKDFHILNVRRETRGDETDTLLLGNLLSFYEQSRLYEEKDEALRPYNLEKPLWVFVGSTVNAVYKRDGQPRSDVLTVVRFIHRFLQDREWAVKTIEAVLKGKTGLRTADGQELFAGRFGYLAESHQTSRSIYKDILSRLFHTTVGGGLHLCNIRSGDGELALKATGAEEYFGLIYIGDATDFKNLVESDQSGIVLEEDAIRGSLFGHINRPESRIHILIGAKKFMEGWNSWRVSSMGLLNIGRQEGSQIIQLFGRGVRLRGKDLSLKRSSALSGNHPQYLKTLETLNIFAVRADYMGQFRNYLEKEGVEVEPPIDLPLFVQPREEFFHKGLLIPRTSKDIEFSKEVSLLLEPDPAISIRADMSARVESIESTSVGVHAATVQAGKELTIPRESLDLVDWEQAYVSLLEYKATKGLNNLIVHPETPRRIIEKVPCAVVGPPEVVKPRSFEQRTLLQNAISQLLQEYVDRFHRNKREKWEEQSMVFHRLSGKDPNIGFNQGIVKEQEAPVYVVRAKPSEEEFIKTVRRLMRNSERLIREENAGLPRIHFDRHLYLPLLLEQTDKAKMIPPGLNSSEATFVRDLRDFWNAEHEKSMAGWEVFLLRNLTHGKGVGFFEERRFYPDFILWVVGKDVQKIVFIEPHGMIYAKAYAHDEKAQLHERLPELAKEITGRSKVKKGKIVKMDAYVISKTSYDDLYKRYEDGTWDRNKFAEKHILFQERTAEYDYMTLLFEGLMK